MTVLLIHGGGWIGGGVNDFAETARHLRANRVRSRIVDYPLHGFIPTQIQYIRGIIHEEKAKGRKVFTYGQSAGAQLATYFAARGEVDGAINVSGPMILDDWKIFGIPVTQDSWWKDRPGMTMEIARQMSPYYRLTSRAAPTLMLYDPVDQFVPFKQAEMYLKKARKRQRDTRLIVVRSKPNTGLYGHNYPTPKYRNVAVRWIKQH